MREQVQKPENTSRTIKSNPRASNQAPVGEILQAYQDRIEGKPVQRQSVDEEELLQAKAAQQDYISAVLQRYSERNIQRNAPEEDEELIQGKFDTAQRETIDEDELLQGKFGSDTQTEQEPVQREEKPNNTGLPDNLKTGIENLSGYSMDDVKVHYNSDKPAQLQALAYTQGTDIYIAPGQEKHLTHEAWHVVQQKQGRVQPTMQLQGVNVNDNEGLEKEADVMGNTALLKYNSDRVTNSKILKTMNEKPTIQREKWKYGRSPRWIQIWNAEKKEFRSIGDKDVVDKSPKAYPDKFIENLVWDDEEEKWYMYNPEDKVFTLYNTTGDILKDESMVISEKLTFEKYEEKSPEGKTYFGHKFCFAVKMKAKSIKWEEKTNNPYIPFMTENEWYDLYEKYKDVSEVFKNAQLDDRIYKEYKFFDPPAIFLEKSKNRCLEIKITLVDFNGAQIIIKITQNLETDESAKIIKQSFEFEVIENPK